MRWRGAGPPAVRVTPLRRLAAGLGRLYVGVQTHRMSSFSFCKIAPQGFDSRGEITNRTSCINGCTKMGTAGSNPRPIRSDLDRRRPMTCISDRNAVPMVAMGPFRSPLRPGWVTGSALLSGVCAAHARSSGARRVAELRPLRRTGRLSPAHNFAKANLHADQRDVDAPSGPNVRFFLSAARA